MSFMGDSRGGLDGFFGNVMGSIEKGADKIFNQVLPVWTAKELNLQSNDQLNQSLFNQETAPPTMGNYPATTESARPVKTGFLFDNVNVSGGAVLGVAVAVVVGLIIAKS